MSKRSASKASVDPVSAEDDEDKTKVAAMCTSCGEIYAAERWPDGKIRPIGRKDGCRCGVGEFEAIDSPKSSV